MMQAWEDAWMLCNSHCGMVGYFPAFGKPVYAGRDANLASEGHQVDKDNIAFVHTTT